jgi:hypothetical protein
MALKVPIRDQSNFHACCRTRSSAKSPGPYSITNDVIKVLPTEIITLIHQLFRVGCGQPATPQLPGSTAIDTCMIYKKGNPTNTLNYRPIGMASTVFKVWTRMVTCVMYE